MVQLGMGVVLLLNLVRSRPLQAGTGTRVFRVPRSGNVSVRGKLWLSLALPAEKSSPTPLRLATRKGLRLGSTTVSGSVQSAATVCRRSRRCDTHHVSFSWCPLAGLCRRCGVGGGGGGTVLRGHSVDQPRWWARRLRLTQLSKVRIPMPKKPLVLPVLILSPPMLNDGDLPLLPTVAPTASVASSRVLISPASQPRSTGRPVVNSVVR